MFTPPSIISRDIEVQTSDQEQSSPPTPEPPIEEVLETPPPSLPPIVDMLFSHMNGVNQWINRYCISNEGIQNDINAIRVCEIFFSIEMIVGRICFVGSS